MEGWPKPINIVYDSDVFQIARINRLQLVYRNGLSPWHYADWRCKHAARITETIRRTLHKFDWICKKTWWRSCCAEILRLDNRFLALRMQVTYILLRVLKPYYIDLSRHILRCIPFYTGKWQKTRLRQWLGFVGKAPHMETEDGIDSSSFACKCHLTRYRRKTYVESVKPWTSCWTVARPASRLATTFSSFGDPRRASASRSWTIIHLSYIL